MTISFICEIIYEYFQDVTEDVASMSLLHSLAINEHTKAHWLQKSHESQWNLIARQKLMFTLQSNVSCSISNDPPCMFCWLLAWLVNGTIGHLSLVILPAAVDSGPGHGYSPTVITSHQTHYLRQLTGLPVIQKHHNPFVYTVCKVNSVQNFDNENTYLGHIFLLSCAG